MVTFAFVLSLHLSGCVKKASLSNEKPISAAVEVFTMSSEQERVLDQFLEIPFVRVDGFAYDTDIGVKHCSSGVVLPQLKLCEAAKGKQISTDAVQSLRSVLGDKSTWGSSTKACFFPRHSFVFLGEDAQPIGEIMVCFQCSKAAFKTPGEPVIEYGLSQSGYPALVKLCRQSQLDGCPL